eukprot:scaffold5823_cov295-Prasinococcus_capsulatus_cf.AAC.2
MPRLTVAMRSQNQQVSGRPCHRTPHACRSQWRAARTPGLHALARLVLTRAHTRIHTCVHAEFVHSRAPAACAGGSADHAMSAAAGREERL